MSGESTEKRVNVEGVLMNSILAVTGQHGGKVALFTNAGVFIGTPTDDNPVEKGLEKVVSMMKEEHPDTKVRLEGGETLCLSNAIFMPYSQPAVRVNMEMAFVLVKSLVAVTGGTDIRMSEG